MNPKILKNPYFYSAKMAPKKVDNLLTFKVANLLTLWRPKRGQPSASPAYIYIAVELITGPRFGIFKVNNWATFVFFF